MNAEQWTRPRAIQFKNRNNFLVKSAWHGELELTCAVTCNESEIDFLENQTDITQIYRSSFNMLLLVAIIAPSQCVCIGDEKLSVLP